MHHIHTVKVNRPAHARIMVSRKRNKGKERKTKKAEKEAEIERTEMRQGWQRSVTGEYNNMSEVTCNHGFDLTMILDNKNHSVPYFIDTFCISMEKGIGSLDNLRDTFQLHQAVWNNASH